MLLFAIFAGVALLLAAVGIYAVTQRRGEFGIRMALGAQKRDVLKLTIGKALKLVLLNVVFGLAGAFALTRLCRAYCWESAPPILPRSASSR